MDLDPPSSSLDAATHGASVTGPPPLRGRALRFVLLDELMGREEMTVAEMSAVVVERHGFDLGGRASKIISDALRWEVRRGRVIRLGRGRYRFSHAARSTTRRIGILATRCRAWVVAIMRTRFIPAPLPAGVWGADSPGRRPGDPPWADLAWLRNA